MYSDNYSQYASEYEISALRSEPSQSTHTSLDQLYESLSLPVGAGMIRLLYLDLFPSPSTIPEEMESRPLQGRLIKVKLTDSPRFAALSYTWGKMRSYGNETIQCGTASIDITPNCADALRAVRRHQFATSGPQLPIWVDALCINQAENPTAVAEKEDQLPLMEEIYQWADPVYIWLGSDDPIVYAGFARLQGFFPACRFRHSTQSLPWITEMRRSERWRKRARYIWDNAFLRGAVCYRLMLALKRRKRARYIWDNSLLQGPMWLRMVVWFVQWTSSELSWPPPQDSGEIQKLLECEWFTRGWTFQEAVLATNPTMLYDDMTLSWIDFLSALEIGFPKLFVDSPAHSLGSAWMNIRRPLHWNGILKRLPPRSWRDRGRVLSGSYLTFRQYLDTRGPECSRDITSPPQNHNDTSFCHGDNLLSWLHLLHFWEEIVVWAIVFMPLYFRLLVTKSAVILHFMPRWLDWLFSLSYGFFAMSMFYEFCVFPQRTSRGIQDLCVMPLITGSNVKEERMAVMGNANVSTGMSRDSVAFIEPSGGSPDVLLQALMRAVRERRTSNSHDGAYAYFGVLKANGFNMPEVDYSQSPARVYRDFLKSLLGSDPSLIGLIVDVSTRRGEGFHAPSWVCHWGGQDQPHCMITPKYIYNTAESNATPNSRPYAEVSNDGCMLTVHGFLSDHIAYYSPRLVAFPESDVVKGVDVRSAAGKAILAFSDWLMHATRHLAVNIKYYPLPGTIFEILHGRFEDGTHNRPIVHQNRGFDAWYGIMTRSIGTIHPEEMKSPERRADLLQLIVAGLLRNQDAKKCLVKFANRLASGRRLIFTENQDLAIGYGEVHKGDIISLVAGVAIPLVVRETGEDRYTLVGPAIVPTWMDGEEWKRLSGGNIDMSTKRIVLV